MIPFLSLLDLLVVLAVCVVAGLIGGGMLLLARRQRAPAAPRALADELAPADAAPEPGTTGEPSVPVTA